MKCFYHHDRDAVGTCKSCQRGLCPECAVELDRGLACRGRCEEDAKALIHLIQTNLRLSPMSQSLLKSTRGRSIQTASFALVSGGLFAGWGYYRDINFIMALGICYLFYGALSLTRALRITPAPKLE